VAAIINADNLAIQHHGTRHQDVADLGRQIRE
jgi:hypothetical protein